MAGLAGSAGQLRDMICAESAEQPPRDEAEVPLVEDVEAGDGPRPLAAGRWRRATLRAAVPLASAAAFAAVVAWRSGAASSGLLRSRLEGRPEMKEGFHAMQEGFGWTDFGPVLDPDHLEACGELESDQDWVATSVIATINDVATASMCCSACAAYPDCAVWTWGAVMDKQWVTHVCWLKDLEAGAEVGRNEKPGLMSGYPGQGVRHRKGGIVPPPPSHTELMDGVVPKDANGRFDDSRDILANAGDGSGKCPGSIFIEGHGLVSLINTGTNTPGQQSGKVQAIANDLVVPHMTGRTYFGKSCAPGDYSPQEYETMQLLGKKIRWTTDISGTGCGCNAAFYFVSMAQNSEISSCNDYYCDAASVCKVPCNEIDIQEANQYSWMSTLHAYNPTAGADGIGVGIGYGGSLNEIERRDWTSLEYGPGARCIDTTRPFQVSTSFPTDESGTLRAMEVELSQEGMPCTVGGTVARYDLQGHDTMVELTHALQAGMTPVISYWESSEMLWLDGLAADGRGSCVKDSPDMCPDTVRFYGFSVESL